MTSQTAQNANVYGMRRHNIGQTWLDPESLAYSTPTGTVHGSRRRALVECESEDRKLRTATVGVPDTVWTIPAYIWRGGRRVHGFITVRTEDDLDSGTPLAFTFYERGNR